MIEIEQMNFEIADIRFRYQYIEPLIIDEKAPIFNFSSNDNNCDITNIIETGKLSAYSDKNKRFVTPAWTLYNMDNVQKVVFHPDNTYIGYMYIYENNNIYTKVIDYSFVPNILPVSMTGFLLQQYLNKQKSGFIMHGATLRINDCCFILTGNSGVGKSTLSALLRKHANATSITDDRFILRKLQGDFYSYGNPFDMKNILCKNDSKKIDKIFFLHHGRENKISRLSEDEALKRIFTICLLPHWNKTSMTDCISTLKQIIATIPLYDFNFLPDETSVSYLMSFL